MSSSAANSATLPLLLEIGCEEIPARFLPQAQKDLGERLLAALAEARLLPRDPLTLSLGERVEGAVSPQTFSTPRRLVAAVPAILERQPDKTEEVLGPPVKVAFDAAGKPTRAAESFAHKNAADVKDLIRVTTPKGEYLALQKTTAGRAALEVLGEILPGVITGISFPKSMYWEASKIRFVRPIRWIVALLGEGDGARPDQIGARVVPFEVAGESSGALTYGHRLAGSAGIEVNGFREYSEKLRTAYVEFDPENRRQTVRTELNMLLENSLEAVPDDDLVEWIVNSTEWLSGIRGDFDKRFLHLPREILITVMRDRQKYFAVQDSQGKLQPHFVAMLGRDRDPSGTIRAGHERVLTARFSDAEFFWKADQKIPLRDRVPILDRVTYQAKLGSYGDKVQRMKRLARALSYQLLNQNRLSKDATIAADRATELCKCDLTTQMVQEFTELQGVVGGLYAMAQGEPKDVANAIYDHYKPQGIDDNCPRSLLGAVVALADKIDAVASGFAAGLAPSGSSDPFGLRRQASGAVRILLRMSISTNLGPLVLDTIDALSKDDPTLYTHTARAQSLAGEIVDFFRERVASYVEAVEGLKYDVVRAALAARDPADIWRAMSDDPVNIAARARDCSEVKVRHEEAFLRLSSASKRIRNILTKSAEGAAQLGDQFRTELFEREQERALAEALRRVGNSARQLAAQRRFASALKTISELSEPVDQFFDSVMVMTEDIRLRENRLRLLNCLNGVFTGIIDFSQIVVEGIADREGSGAPHLAT